MVILWCYIDLDVILNWRVIADSKYVAYNIYNTHWESNRVEENSPSPQFVARLNVFTIDLPILKASLFSKFNEQEKESHCG